MKALHPIPQLRKSDGGLHKVMTRYATKTNYRRIFYNQAIPVLAHFANKQTLVFLFLLYNSDSNNEVFCTYSDIMNACDIKDRSTVSTVLRELVESEAIVKIHASHYMINPAITVQGNNQKFGECANNFNSYVMENKQTENSKKGK